MTAAIAHAPRGPRKCWDEDQYRAIHAYVLPRRGNGMSLRGLLKEAQTAVGIPAHQHREWPGSYAAESTWAKAQKAAGVNSAEVITFPVAVQAVPAPAAVQAAPVLKLTAAELAVMAPHLKAGTVVEIV